MTAAELRMSPRARRWAGVLLLSAALHGLLLGAFALRLPAGPPAIGAAPADVDLTAAPALVRWPEASAAQEAPAVRSRSLVSAAAPRYAGPPQAATGEASDAVDLFGPVFADGQWPRPLVVQSEPCDPQAAGEPGDHCRRELLFIGLASEAPAGSKAQP